MKKFLLSALVALSVLVSFSPVYATALTVDPGTGNEVAAPSDTVTVTTPPAEVNPGSTVVIAAEDKDKNTMDFSGLAAGFAIAVYGLFAMLAVGAYKLLQKIPFFKNYVTEEQYQNVINPLLNEAIAWGVGQLEKADWLKVDTKNEAVANAVNYALAHGGDALEKFGITRELLVEKLEAKLVQNGWDKKPGEWTGVHTDADNAADTNTVAS